MRTIFYPDLDLLYHEAESGFSVRDFNALGERTYSLDRPPRFSIWDFGGSISAFETTDVRSIAEPSSSTFSVRERAGGKTAIVARHPVTFGRARQYVSFSEPESLPFPQQVFRSVDQALGWLGLSASELETAEREVFYESQ